MQNPVRKRLKPSPLRREPVAGGNRGWTSPSAPERIIGIRVAQSRPLRTILTGVNA